MINKKTILGILGALGIAAASGAGGKIASTLMERNINNDVPDPDDGHEPTPEELEELASEYGPHGTEEELVEEIINEEVKEEKEN